MASINPHIETRSGLLLQLDYYLEEGSERSTYTGLLRVNIENIQSINESFGYAVGSQVLLTISKQLADIAQFSDCFFALAESEFALILPFLKNPLIAEIAVEKVKQTLNQQQDNDNITPIVNIGVGISAFGELLATDILLLSEAALTEAKDSLEKTCIYSKRDSNRANNLLNIEEDLKTAIERSDLELWFQPKVNLREGTVSSFEALLRWKRDSLFLAPDIFIPQAERSEVIFPLTKWVIHNAFRVLNELTSHYQAGMESNWNVSINISKPCFANEWLEDELKRALAIWNIPGEKITLEITETAFMEGLKTIQKSCTGIRNTTACQISIDDFGTGFSSFEFFKEVHAEELKIDKTFISGINNSSRLQSIVRCMVDLAKSANMKTVVEGVETAQELKDVLALDVDFAQGYFLAKPIPENQLIDWIENQAVHIERTISEAKHSV